MKRLAILAGTLMECNPCTIRDLPPGEMLEVAAAYSFPVFVVCVIFFAFYHIRQRALERQNPRREP